MRKLNQAIANASKIGLDTSVFIYFIEKNHDFLDLTRNDLNILVLNELEL